MKFLVGVKFSKYGKTYYFNPADLELEIGNKIIVDTVQGEDLVEVISMREIEEDKLDTYSKVIRIATEQDLEQKKECEKLEKEAVDVFNQKIKEFGLAMNLEYVEYRLDHSKLLFYFTSEDRIDFRELVKDLATIYRTRIELRQIGIREQVKRCGGFGVCGKQLCCCTYLHENNLNINVKMAKEQNLSLNPYKISGCCGRLLCCLKYESEVYEEKLERLPKIGTQVETPDGIGVIDTIETLSEKIRVKLKDEEGYIYKKYTMDDIKVYDEKAKEEREKDKDTDIKEEKQKENIEKKEHKKEEHKIENKEEKEHRQNKEPKKNNDQKKQGFKKKFNKNKGKEK